MNSDRLKTFSQLYESAISNYADNNAVTDADRCLTYSQLDRVSGAIASYLKSIGAGKGQVVGIYADRSVEFIAAALGVFRAGAAYTAIDSEYPVSRVNYIVEDADICVVLRHKNMSERPLAAGVEVYDIDIDRLLESGYEPFETDQDAQSPAYIIYTSGSTGQPKGAIVGYGNFLNIIQWQREFYGITAQDKTSWIARVGFDASLFEIWAYIISGASVNIPQQELLYEPSELLKWIAEKAITICFMPTPLAESCLDITWPGDVSLRYLFSGGDALRKRPAKSMAFRMFDHYGPSECAIVTSAAEIRPGDSEPSGFSNIGKPISGVQMYILSDDLKKVEPGEIGEIYIGGTGVGLGYLNNPQLTAQSFLPDPFSKVKGAKIYKSGDLGKLLPDGSFEFHGRTDRQVKIRGHRIELGEIENILISCPEVKDAAVVASEGGSTQKRIIAYIVPSDGASGKLQAALKGYLAKKLPFYMMPSQFVEMESLPVSINGKIDRLKLSQMGATAAAESEGNEKTVAGDTESRLFEIWKDVLGKGVSIGVDDDFFDIGGDSLKAGRVVSRIREEFEIDFSVKTFFSEPTIAKLALAVKCSDASKNDIEAITGITRPQEIPATLGQSHIILLNDMQQNKAVCNIVGVMEIDGFVDRGTFEKALNLLTARHESLRTEFYSNEQMYCQRICPDTQAAMEYEDILRVRPENKADRAEKLIRDYSHTEFDVERAPLYKFALIRLEDRHYKFVIVIHHSIADGWSMGIFVRDLMAMYEAVVKNTEPLLPPLTVQYADYACWLNMWLKSPQAAKQMRYWMDYLEGAHFRLDLKCTNPRKEYQTFEGSRCHLHISQELTARIERLNTALESTMYMTLLSAYAVLLYHYSGCEKFVIGSPVANRIIPEVENIIGLFINSIQQKFEIRSKTTLKDIIRNTRKASINALGNQNIPFEKVVNAVKPPRDPSRHPIFQHLFIFQNAHIGQIECAGMKIKFDEIGSDTAKLDLTLDMQKRADCLEGWFEYNTELFDRDVIEQMAERFVSILEIMSQSPDISISELEKYKAVEVDQEAAVETAADLNVEIEPAAAVAQEPQAEPIAAQEVPLSESLAAVTAEAENPPVVVEEPVAEQPAAKNPDTRLDYWINNLKNANKHLIAANSHKRSRDGEYADGVYEFELAENLVSGIDGFGIKENYTLFTFMLTAYTLLLYEHSGQESIVVGADFAAGAGDPVTGIPGLNFNITDDMIFRDVLEQAKANERGAIENQGVDFELAAEKLEVSSSELCHPIYQYKLACGVERDKQSVLSDRKPDMVCSVIPNGTGINVSVRYNANMFTEQAVETMFEHFQDIIEVLVLEPDREIESIPIYSAEPLAVQYEAVEDFFEDEAIVDDGYDFEEFESIVDMFTSQAVDNPEFAALSDRYHSLTYGQLNDITNILAGKLLRLGITNNCRVGILAGRGAGFVVCALATFKAGAGYVALDAEYPKQRLNFMIEDAEISVILKFADVDTELSADAEVIDVNIKRLLAESAPALNIIPELNGGDLAYVIYTSGSTGKPKGVEVTHANLLHLIKWQRSYYNITAKDCSSHLARPGFDTSVSEIWPYLATGCRVCIPPDEVILEPSALMAWINKNNVTISDITTPLAEVVIFEDWPEDTSLRVLKTGGDRLHKHPPAGLPFMFVNEYGPTECTVISTAGVVECAAEGAAAPHIGKAIDGAAIYILNSELQPVPDGVEGEIFIGGGGVARGYIKRPDLTAEKFLADPFSNVPGARMYRSGDLGRFLPDGNIEFIGRSDFQVQVRGFRVELGEIENAIIASGKVKEAAVVAAGPEGNIHILAYIVADTQDGQVPAGLNSYLKQNLPDYMVPSSYFMLKELPLTHNGKIDRKKLSSLSDAAASSTEVHKPRNPMEEVLTNIWSKLLDRENVGIYDNFFEIGGNSLMIIKMENMLRHRGLSLPVEAIFQKPQIAQLAAFLEFRRASAEKDDKWTSLIELNKGSAQKLPLYLLHSTPGDILGYSHLVYRLGKDQPCYGLQSLGLCDNQLCHHTIEEMAAHYVSLITEFQPEGPYLLAGWCFGGFVAFEMARQLKAAGKSVALLGFIETPSLYPPIWYLPYYIDLFINVLKLGPKRIFGHIKAKMTRERQLDNAEGTIAEGFDVQDDSEAKNQYVSNRKIVYLANLEAARKYRPRFYGGNVIQFTAEEREMWVARGDDMGWKTLVKSVKVDRISGDHMGILREPNVTDLAKKIRAEIDAVSGAK